MNISIESFIDSADYGTPLSTYDAQEICAYSEQVKLYVVQLRHFGPSAVQQLIAYRVSGIAKLLTVAVKSSVMRRYYASMLSSRLSVIDRIYLTVNDQAYKVPDNQFECYLTTMNHLIFIDNYGS